MQSERTPLYRKHADILIQSGHAYRCFCSAERLKAVAETNAKIGLHTQYDRTCYHLPNAESDDRAAQGQKYIVRLKDPERQPYFRDIVQGNIRDGKATLRQASDSFDDPVLLKTDGLPTYHLANVVDDHLMDITHVIRGAEWIISTRKHLIMYNAFGWTPPAFGHVGLLLDRSGSKLSKREKSIDLSGMQEDGVLPEALNNFLVLLGWDKKRHQGDLLTMDQLREQVYFSQLQSLNSELTACSLTLN
jgi:glutamyl-tRNA synthetase